MVAVTFDDGYREVYTRAWPVLRDLRIPATVFLPTGFMEGTAPAPIRAGAAERGDPPAPLTWDQVGEMARGRARRRGLALGHAHRLRPTLARSRRGGVRGPRGSCSSGAPARPSTCSRTRAPSSRTRTSWPHTTDTRSAADGVKNLARGLAPHRLTRTPVRASRRDVLPPPPARGDGAARGPAVRAAAGRPIVTEAATTTAEVPGARPKLVHVTTVDMSLDVLLGYQLRRFAAAGFEVVGVSAPGPHVAGPRGRRHPPRAGAAPHAGRGRR